VALVCASLLLCSAVDAVSTIKKVRQSKRLHAQVKVIPCPTVWAVISNAIQEGNDHALFQQWDAYMSQPLRNPEYSAYVKGMVKWWEKYSELHKQYAAAWGQGFGRQMGVAMYPFALEMLPLMNNLNIAQDTTRFINAILQHAVANPFAGKPVLPPTFKSRISGAAGALVNDHDANIMNMWLDPLAHALSLAGAHRAWVTNVLSPAQGIYHQCNQAGI